MKLEKIDDFTWQIPREGEMRVSGRVFASEEMIRDLQNDMCLQQVKNVATLPGILSHSFAMPDVHWGYGFPIGGVAAFDEKEGIVSPGGVGYDINCGVRLLKTGLQHQEIRPFIRELVLSLFSKIPTGVGAHQSSLHLQKEDQRQILQKGAAWAIEQGYGNESDLDYIEEQGCLKNAQAKLISDRALERGRSQLGTLGSGNHFVEVGYVDKIYNDSISQQLQLEEGEVTVIIHTGSRGLGHQTCEDHLGHMGEALKKYKIKVPDPQLACAPLISEEAQTYLAAMAGAANFAFANRQMISHLIRESFSEVLERYDSDLGIRVVYDLCHNIAKFEEHKLQGVSKRVCVHRKGATRAFGPGNLQLPGAYQKMGQPVLIPGDMGRYSFLLLGSSKAEEVSFGSTCHGAGRKMSRNQAKKALKGRNLEQELANNGIFIRAASRSSLAEEAPIAYKDVAEVVEVVHKLGLSQKIAKLRPLGVIKG